MLDALLHAAAQAILRCRCADGSWRGAIHSHTEFDCSWRKTADDAARCNPPFTPCGRCGPRVR